MVRADSVPQIVVDQDPFEASSRLLAEAILEVLTMRAHARLAIPGGSALAAVTALKARLGQVWGDVALTWTDERCVPFDDADSNHGEAARRGLCSLGRVNGTGIEPARVLPLYLDGEVPGEAVTRVEAAMTAQFGDMLDIVLLGMGADGHVASLFPSRRGPAAGLVASVSKSPKPPAERITLTRAAIATADRIVLVAVGEEKRDALCRLVDGDTRLPAQGLEGLVIVTDLEGIDAEEVRNVE
jgi:6-phosphogluconolactonase